MLNHHSFINYVCIVPYTQSFVSTFKSQPFIQGCVLSNSSQYPFHHHLSHSAHPSLFFLRYILPLALKSIGSAAIHSLYIKDLIESVPLSYTISYRPILWTRYPKCKESIKNLTGPRLLIQYT